MATLDSSVGNPLVHSTAAKNRTAWSESAYDWLLRSQQLQARSRVPVDPSSAAWAFVRPSTGRNGTGTAFIDTALMKHVNNTSLPVIEIRGGHRTGKTATLITLAARFVADTRPSRFQSSCEGDGLFVKNDNLPQVVIFDTHLDMTAPRLLCAVRSTLLRQSSPDDAMSEDVLEKETIVCMSRIHIVSSEDMSGWIPALESLRARLSSVESSDEHPTLFLWDGCFLNDATVSGGAGEHVAERMEVIRQLTRLFKDCTILLILSTLELSTRKFGQWDKHVSQRITLEEQTNASVLGPESGGGRRHAFVASVQNAHIPYSMTTGGVLS